MSLNDPKVLCVDIIFLDYSNAFGNVSDSLLLEGLYAIGVVSQCLAINHVFCMEEIFMQPLKQSYLYYLLLCEVCFEGEFVLQYFSIFL